jgi:hypothetical protein
VVINTWNAEQRRFTIGDGDKAVAQIHTFFYPYWELRTSEGSTLSTRPDSDGVLVADVPSGPQAVEMKFVRPRHQTLANLLSLMGIAALATIALVTIRRSATTSPA